MSSDIIVGISLCLLVDIRDLSMLFADEWNIKWSDTNVESIQQYGTLCRPRRQ